MRPEFVIDYPVALNADGFLKFNKSDDNSLINDNMELINARHKLINEKIPLFIKSLENLDNLPVDSWSFTKDIHSAGINIRYIGLIAENAKLPHICNLCMIEMVARTCKKIYRHEMFSVIS